MAGDGFREKTLAERREFFEKLVVLDGGTIALSVSLLGNLASRHAPELVRLIGTSWVLLAIGMALGMTRNWFFQESGFAGTDLSVGRALAEFPWAEVAAMAKMPEMNVAEGENRSYVERTEDKVARLRVCQLWCECTCISSTLGGYAFLIWFAIRNLSAFTTIK